MSGRPRGSLSGHTPALRKRIREMHAAGLNQHEIAERLNVTRPSVTYHAKAMGLPFVRGYHARRAVRAAAE